MHCFSPSILIEASKGFNVVLLVTAGTWFGVEALIAAGERADSPAITKAVDAILA